MLLPTQGPPDHGLDLRQDLGHEEFLAFAEVSALGPSQQDAYHSWRVMGGFREPQKKIIVDSLEKGKFVYRRALHLLPFGITGAVADPWIDPVHDLLHRIIAAVFAHVFVVRQDLGSGDVGEAALSVDPVKQRGAGLHALL